MALDGIALSRDRRLLTNREAALLHGTWWECADDGTHVWERLTMKPSPERIVRHATEAQAVFRARQNLKKRRVVVHMHIEQLTARLQSINAMPLARLLARKSLREVEAELAAQRKALADLPESPAIQRLDPDASCGVSADYLSKEIAAEMVEASQPAIAPSKPAPAPIPVLAIEPPSPAAAPATTPASQPVRIAPVIPAAPLDPDSIEALATQPFDESLLR